MLLQVNTFNLTPKNHVQVQIGSGRKMRIAMMTKTCRRMRKKMMRRKAVGRKMMDLGSWPSMATLLILKTKRRTETMIKLETMRMTMTMLKMRRAMRTKAGGKRGNWISIVAS